MPRDQLHQIQQRENAIEPAALGQPPVEPGVECTILDHAIDPARQLRLLVRERHLDAQHLPQREQHVLLPGDVQALDGLPHSLQHLRLRHTVGVTGSLIGSHVVVVHDEDVAPRNGGPRCVDRGARGIHGRIGLPAQGTVPVQRRDLDVLVVHQQIEIGRIEIAHGLAFRIEDDRVDQHELDLDPFLEVDLERGRFRILREQRRRLDHQRQHQAETRHTLRNRSSHASLLDRVVSKKL